MKASERVFFRLSSELESPLDWFLSIVFFLLRFRSVFASLFSFAVRQKHLKFALGAKKRG